MASLIFSSATACAGSTTSGCVAKMVSRAYGSRSETSDVIETRPRSSSLRTVAAVVAASSTSSDNKISRRSSMMFQTSCWRFGNLGNSPLAGSARTNSRSRQPASSFRTASGKTDFNAVSGAAAIVLADPPRELQNFRRHQGLRADDFENGFEIRVAGFLGDGGDDAENFPRAERNLHAAADIHLSGQFGRNGIIKFLAQRNFETDASDHFLITRNGAQFGFEFLPEFFAAGIRVFTRHEQHPTSGHFAAGKWQRNQKTIPAFQLNLPVQIIRHRHERPTGDLPQHHRSFSHNVTRPARPVRRDGEVIAAHGPRGQFQQCLRAAPAARTAHRLDPETV